MTLARALAIFLLPLLLAVGLRASAADAAPPPPADPVHRIERETGGRVLSVQRSQRGGREVNRIKVYTPEGRVRVMWDYPNRLRAETPRRAERDRTAPVAPAPRSEREPPARDDR